jgi:hypothetical protein
MVDAAFLSGSMAEEMQLACESQVGPAIDVTLAKEAIVEAKWNEAEIDECSVSSAFRIGSMRILPEHVKYITDPVLVECEAQIGAALIKEDAKEGLLSWRKAGRMSGKVVRLLTLPVVLSVGLYANIADQINMARFTALELRKIRSSAHVATGERSAGLYTNIADQINMARFTALELRKIRRSA